MIDEQPRNPLFELSPEELRHFFIRHLNRIYCAKSKLAEKLPELAKRSHFLDLQQAIAETVEMVELQLLRIREVYIHLDAFYHPESCTGLTGILDEAFQSIGSPVDSPALRDLSVLFYMQNIESIEIASFKMMMLVADQLNEKEVVQLLLECYDEAREDKVLLREITANYL
jgi:ferritin-like metal-binding protein YciE